MRKGFTLVELLIVLAVIAALMAVATPLALNAVKNAKASQVAQNFRNIKAAFENWWNTERPSPVANTTITNLRDSGYLSKSPAGFSDTITVTSVASEPGVYDVTISYTAGDVDTSKLQQYYPEVSGTTLTFRVQKWW
uniref:Type II secretion system protein n=1 Tax=Fervidobacterium thailandense TaxID=1008305 RepID=A0A7C4VTK5_9BACT